MPAIELSRLTKSFGAVRAVRGIDLTVRPGEIIAFLGGLFTPLDQMGHTFRTIAKLTPMYGVSELAHAPLTGESPGWASLVSVLVWLAVFAGGGAWRFRRDTARV